MDHDSPNSFPTSEEENNQDSFQEEMSSDQLLSKLALPEEELGATACNSTACKEVHEDETEAALQKNAHSSLLISILDALLFASQKALSLRELLSCVKAAAAAFPEEAPGAFSGIKEKEILETLHALRNELSTSQRSYELRETASGWQLVTKSIFAPWIRQLFPEARPSRLSAPALETLAIVAYRQPITRADVEAVRGVAVDGVVQTLMDRGLIRIAGRADVPGRPLLYATSESFLNHFGLRNLEELPNATELGTIPLPKAPTAVKEATNAAEEKAASIPLLNLTDEGTVNETTSSVNEQNKS